MPELPEVETVRTSLEQAIPSGTIIQKVVLHRKDLRFPFPQKLSATLQGQRIQSFRRRAKYLLWDLEEHTLISHLGMTGTWRLAPDNSKLSLHDHVDITLSDSRHLIYRDPRRFGYMDIAARQQEEKSIYIQHLGPEPLSHQFTGDYLWQLTEKRTAPVKNVIMDQRIVVGVGNIYACEALYLTGIRPTMGAHKLSKVGAKNLVKHIQNILVRAIKAGGSTISDFKQAQEQSGYFQMQFHVYGKKDLPCATCGTKIKNKTLAGRSSFYCPKCQK
ncbi:MAG: bifunctional DNA-formamidopyrimidine glycosylase/DNA-(apurinic or apyrimidinic site) lyase [Deltaproteobacteria bacterium]|nr:bifunctional DNA-formamidopyrimidine glycosylase/DNA-(apurinic or apyrimidinic site) lyase [Deltaproteobacteria bacterium]